MNIGVSTLISPITMYISQFFYALIVFALLPNIFSNSDTEKNFETNVTVDSNHRNPILVRRVMLYEFRHLHLVCSASKSNQSVVWIKDTTDGSENDETQTREFFQSRLGGNLRLIPNQTTSHLRIMKANSSDLGNYVCGNRLNKPLMSFIVRAKPRVKFNISQYERSETVLVNAEWSLTCEFMNAYYARDADLALVRCESYLLHAGLWCGRASLAQLIRDTESWLAGNSARIKMHSQNLTKAGAFRNSTDGDSPVSITLQITRVRFRDIGYYMCVGKNFFSQANTTMLLRVRDPHDSAWPAAVLTGLALYFFSLVAIFETRRIRATSFLKLESSWDKIH